MTRLLIYDTPIINCVSSRPSHHFTASYLVIFHGARNLSKIIYSQINVAIIKYLPVFVIDHRVYEWAYILAPTICKVSKIVKMKRSATLVASSVMLFVIISINTRLTIKKLLKILMKSPHCSYRINVSIIFILFHRNYKFITVVS